MLRYAITDGLSWPRSDRNEVARVPGTWTALAGLGVDVIVVREPRLSASELTKLTRQILSEVRLGPARVLGVTRVLVARRLDVALAAAADGVHLSSGAGELSPAQVRRLMPGAHITQSAHSLEEVRRIEGADAILFAPVFGKMVDGQEVSPPAGLALLREALPRHFDPGAGAWGCYSGPGRGLSGGGRGGGGGHSALCGRS